MNASNLGAHVLAVWDRSIGRPQAERAALALELAPPEQRAASNVLFARDAALLSLRIKLLGTPAEAVVCCPACGTDFDLPLDLSVFDRAVPAADFVTVDTDGFVATVRPPAVRDLLALSVALSPEAFAATLFQRCVEQAWHHDQPVSAAELPPTLRAAASEALVASGLESPHADIACGACGHAWQAPLDIASMLLHDIDTWAVRQLEEVHRIASSYHWAEHDILALSPARRRFYLGAIA